VKNVTLLRQEDKTPRYPLGRSKGCAIVSFFDPETAVVALEEMNGCELLGREMLVRQDNKEGFGVFFANLNYDLTKKVSQIASYSFYYVTSHELN
jgi:RNA recognition motif-containing protein